MKIPLLSWLFLVVIVPMAFAGVGIQWTTANWGENHNGDGTGAGNAFLDNNGGLWQLIYAGANNVADSIAKVGGSWGAGTAGIQDDYVAGDDVVWAQRTIAQGGGTAPEDGTTWDQWLSCQSGNSRTYEDGEWATAGFVFQRVFESAAPTAGSWYFESAILPLDLSYVPGSGVVPMDLYVDSPTGLAADATGPFVANPGGVEGGAGFLYANRQVQLVPEPATMSLLGLGALVMAIPRRRS